MLQFFKRKRDRASEKSPTVYSQYSPYLNHIYDIRKKKKRLPLPLNLASDETTSKATIQTTAISFIFSLLTMTSIQI